MCISDDSGRDVFWYRGYCTSTRPVPGTRSTGPSYRSADTKKLVATVVVLFCGCALVSFTVGCTYVATALCVEGVDKVIRLNGRGVGVVLVLAMVLV